MALVPPLLIWQMAQLVAENILAIDTKFWMRIATRNDTAATKEDKDRLQVRACLFPLEEVPFPHCWVSL